MNEAAKKILKETLDLVAKEYVDNCRQWPFKKAFAHATRQIMNFFPCRDAMDSAYTESRRRYLKHPSSQAANVVYASSIRAVAIGRHKSALRLLKAIKFLKPKAKVALIDAWIAEVSK